MSLKMVYVLTYPKGGKVLVRDPVYKLTVS